MTKIKAVVKPIITVFLFDFLFFGKGVSLFLNMDSFPSIGLFSSTSGRNLRRVIIRITVTIPSIAPIMEWLRAMAGTAMLRPYHVDRGDKPTSMPAAIAASKSPKNAEMKMVAYNLGPIFGLNNLVRTIKMMHGINTPIMPIFRMLAPSAMSPPSAKKKACITNMMDMEIKPANGPKMSPITAPPRRCAVVGPIRGMFIIIAAKKNAVSRPIMGT